MFSDFIKFIGLGSIIVTVVAWMILSIISLQTSQAIFTTHIEDSKVVYEKFNNKLDYQTDILMNIKEDIGNIKGSLDMLKERK